MCSNYNVSARRLEFEEYEIKLPKTFEEVNKRFYPKDIAPIIVSDNKNDKTRLVGMQFSLIPSWSKEPKVKFATHNARIETVLEKPTWKSPFLKHHCVVPMSGFYEAVREGEYAGNVIQFKPKESKLMFAAGIYDIWTNPESQEKLYSFSILTTEPPKFILENGHDRTPIFLEFDKAKKWLEMTPDTKDQREFLLNTLSHPNLTIEVDRALKK